MLSLEHLAGRTYATKLSICSQGIFLPACVYCCMCEHLILLMEIPPAEVLSLAYSNIGAGSWKEDDLFDYENLVDHVEPCST